MRPIGARSRFVGLLALAAALPAIEAAVLAALGYRAAFGLPPQASAVWPYDAYHDLRWLLVYHNSWLGFALELLALVLLRGLVSGALIFLAWPAEARCPSFPALARRNLGIAVLAVVIVSPWAALSMAAAGVALSWYLFASLVPILLVSPFLQRAGALASWWRGLPSAPLVGWSLLNFAVLTIAGTVTSEGAGWWSVPIAALTGVANGLLWQRTVRAAVLPTRVRLSRVPVAPVAVLLVFLLPVLVQVVVGVSAGGRGEWRPPVIRDLLPGTVGHAVVALAGYNSSYNGLPAADPNVERFSYRGLDDRGRPLPYPAVATHQSLETSARLLGEQVDALHRRTGRPVALVGQSEGAMVIRTYLERGRRSAVVDTAVLFSPLVRPGRIYYPPPDRSSGWGVAAGWELRAIFALANLAKSVDDGPDEPFIRSILDDAPFYRNRTLCPVPGIRMVAFVPTSAASEAPPGPYAEIPVFEIPGFHGTLIGRLSSQEELIEVLSKRDVQRRRAEYRPLQRLAVAWQAPSLALSVNPAWRGFDESDPAFTGRICQPG